LSGNLKALFDTDFVEEVDAAAQEFLQGLVDLRPQAGRI